MPKRRIAILLSAICAVPLINVVIIRFNLPYWDRAFYSVADALACGCLLALIRNRAFMGKILISRYFILIPILTLVALPIAGIRGGGVVFALLKSLVLRPWVNVGIALFIEKAVRSAPAILNSKGIIPVGVMSYSIYLWQQPITRLPLVVAPMIPSIFIRLVGIGLCAAGSYFLIELPFLRTRRKLFTSE